MNKVAEFYNEYNERSRLTDRRAGQLEFLMTQEVIDSHLNENDSILDLGAGSGCYSVHYAKKGYAVTAVELSPKLVQEIEDTRDRRSLERLVVFQGNAHELGFLQDRYQVVLCLGPHYHLRDREKRKQCLLECSRLLSPDGTLFLAYVNKHFAISYYHKNGIFLEHAILSAMLSDDFSFSSNMDEFLNISYFTEPALIEKEVKDLGFEIVDHLGIDGPHLLYNHSLETMNEKEWNNFMDYHRSTYRNPSILGYSNHGLVVCRK